MLRVLVVWLPMLGLPPGLLGSRVLLIAALWSHLIFLLVDPRSVQGLELKPVSIYNRQLPPPLFLIHVQEEGTGTTVSDQPGFTLRSCCHIRGDTSVQVWQDLADPARPLCTGPAGTSVHAARAEPCQKHRRHPSGALTFANGAAPPSLLAFCSQSHVMTFSAAPCQRLPLPITHGCSAPAAARGAPSSPPGWQQDGGMLHCDPSPSWLREPQEPPPQHHPNLWVPALECWRRLAFQNHY